MQAADHTGITVTDLERSLAFWRDVLGFDLSHRAQLSGEFAAGVAGVPGAEISIAVVAAPGGHRIELLQYHQPADRAHLRPRPCGHGPATWARCTSPCASMTSTPSSPQPPTPVGDRLENPKR